MDYTGNVNELNRAFMQPTPTAAGMATTARISPMGIVNLPQPAPAVPMAPVAPPTMWDKAKNMAAAFGGKVMNALDPANVDPQNARVAYGLGKLAGVVAPDTAQGRFGAAIADMARNRAVAPTMAGMTQGVAPVSTVKPANNKLGIASALTPDTEEGMTSFSVKPGPDGKPRYTINGTGDYGRSFNEPSLPTEGTRGVAAPAADDLAAAMSVLSPEQQNQIFNARLAATQERRLGVGDAVKQHIDIMKALKGPGVQGTHAGADGTYYNIMEDGSVMPTGVKVPPQLREISGWSGSQEETGYFDTTSGKYTPLLRGAPPIDTSARDARLLDLDMRRTAAIDKVITEAAQTLDKASRYEETLRGGKKRTRYRTVPSTYIGAYNQRLYNLGSPVRFAKFDIKKSQLGDNSWWLGDDDATSVVFQANTDDTPTMQAERAAAAIMETFGADYPTAMRVVQNMLTSKERKEK